LLRRDRPPHQVLIERQSLARLLTKPHDEPQAQCGTCNRPRLGPANSARGARPLGRHPARVIKRGRASGEESSG
jgi:hypothetical protein